MPPKSNTTMRRRDRAQTDPAWIRTMLATAPTGVLATVRDGQPFLNANLFVYDDTEDVIYVHTARRGQTRANIEGDERVCFTVMELGRLLPADTALESSCEFASVVAFGRGAVVEDRDEARSALQAILDKYFADRIPGRDYRAITDDELKRTAVYRVRITDWSGKRKKVAPDFPDARFYHAPSMIDHEVATAT